MTLDRRRLLLGALISALLLAGLATRAGGLVALALPLLVYLAGAMLAAPQAPQVQITRSLGDPRADENKPVAVRLCIANQGPALEELWLRDLVPAGLEVVHGAAEVLASLPRGATLELDYTVVGARGRFRFPGVEVTGLETLGLFRQRVEAPVSAELSLLPRGPQLRRVPIRPFRTRGYAGPLAARQGGSGTDFHGIREYAPGDPPRWINWRASARHPRSLFTNEFERERIADVGLILDARRRTDLQVPGDSLFEHAVRAAASLAEAFLREGNRVALLVYGQWLDWTLPGYGKVQRERILQALARARPGESQVFEHLDFLPTRLFSAQSQLVLVSPLCQDDVRPLLRLRARGYQVLVVQPDPVPFELQALGPEPEVALAARIVRLERNLLLLRLRQAGIQVVRWSVGRPLDQVVHGTLGRTPQWYRALGWEQTR